MLKKVLVVLVVCMFLLLNTAAIAIPVKATWSEDSVRVQVHTSYPAEKIEYISSNSDVNNATNIKILRETQFVVTDSASITQCDSPGGCVNTDVPVPTPAWLFASALGFLCIIRRRLHR